MRHAIVITAVLAVGLFAATSFAGSNRVATQRFSATLSAAQVVPHLKHAPPGATGTFSATITGTVLRWKLTFSHLTGGAVAAHIHLGARGKSGIALVALCGPCKSPVTGTANSVTDDEVALMAKAGAYVNVHTVKNPEGEIRGELTGH